MNKPNIVFFFTDDQRFDTIHALGNEQIITPNMDSLVQSGTTFTNAYIMGGTSGAICMPSRAMMLTGRTLFHLEGQGQNIPEEHVTFPEFFRRAGYVTFGTGKWHNGRPSYARGFSAGDNIFYGGMSTHFAVPVYDFDPSGQYPKEKVRTAEGKHSSDLFSDAAIQFLSNYEDHRPFCMYVSHTAPHDPRQTHKKYHDMYDARRIPLPENFLPEHPFDNGELKIRDEKLAGWPRTPEEIRRHIADYYAMITHLDAQTGRVLEALEETGHAKNTIILLAGDNGLALGRHGLMGKQSLYDHSVHVPLIMNGPGIPEGEKRDAFCYLLDIYPTLCDLSGLPVPDTVEGKSLAPVMRDSGRSLRDSLFFAYKEVQRSVQNHRHKLIEYDVNGKRTTQLFDLQTDPWEMANLAEDASYGEHVRRLRGGLVRWREELDDAQREGATFCL